MAGSDRIAIAEVYARSLLDLASAQGVEDTVDREFSEFAAYLRIDADFRAFVTSRVIDREARSESLDRMLREHVHELLVNTLQVLNRKDRLDLVAAVQEQYHQLYLHQQGIIEVQVTSAEPLNEAARERLSELLRRRSGMEVALVEHVEPDMIGGLIVRIGDEQIDVSVARQLRRFHGILVDHAERHIHAGTNLFEDAAQF